MLADREDLRKEQYKNGGRVAIMAEYPEEKTTDIPEHSHMDPSFWDERARGLGGTLWLPLSTAGEENVLCLNGDRYWNQDILVHEFAHGVMHVSAESFDPTFESRIREVYQNAKDAGKWNNTYAMTNYIEYYAIGVQCFFNNSAEGPVDGDGIHNEINTRDELLEYDPRLYEMILEVWPCANQIMQRCDGGNYHEHLPPSECPLPEMCKDKHNNCKSWAESGQCDSNRDYMEQECRKSCALCQPGPTYPPTPVPSCRDQNDSCAYWAGIGECEANPGYMLDNCEKSCGVCVECKDSHNNCEYWASIGECDPNPGYMLNNCIKSCEVCSGKRHLLPAYFYLFQFYNKE